MTQYAMARVTLMVPVILAVSLLTFAFMRVIPGDVLDVMYADSPLSLQEIADLRHRLGMDKPMPIQYVEWLGGIVKLEAVTRCGHAGRCCARSRIGCPRRSSWRLWRSPFSS